jgi:hypothetical protein
MQVSYDFFYGIQYSGDIQGSDMGDGILPFINCVYMNSPNNMVQIIAL